MPDQAEAAASSVRPSAKAWPRRPDGSVSGGSWPRLGLDGEQLAAGFGARHRRGKRGVVQQRVTASAAIRRVAAAE